jgi:hypothetical protein
MPDSRTHRGPHPEDDSLFGSDEQLIKLRSAVKDLSWLLSRGYAENSSLKIVGDRYSLKTRQRTAVRRASCTDQQLYSRFQSMLQLYQAASSRIVIDGYNLLITIESALSGGYIFTGRDGCFRDMASVHGTYRKVSETAQAAKLIGHWLEDVETGPVLWLLDRPVSNSANLAVLLDTVAAENNFNWQTELVPQPDRFLIDCDQIIVTSDGPVLDKCSRWVNLAAHIIAGSIDFAKIVDMLRENEDI